MMAASRFRQLPKSSGRRFSYSAYLPWGPYGESDGYTISYCGGSATFSCTELTFSLQGLQASIRTTLNEQPHREIRQFGYHSTWSSPHVFVEITPSPLPLAQCIGLLFALSSLLLLCLMTMVFLLLFRLVCLPYLDQSVF